MFATRTQAQNAYDAADAERATVEARVAASKRYKGRAADLRLIASLTEICWAAAEAIREYDAIYDRERTRLAALEVEMQAEDDAAFAQRVATRAYFMWLNGEGTNDGQRWLWAERYERGIDDTERAFTRLDGEWYSEPGDHEGEWLTPAERRRRDRAVGLH